MKTPFAFRFLQFAAVTVLLPAMLLLPRTLTAATFTVVNTNLTGAGSLQQALIDANANAGVDLIAFNIAASGFTISLTNALPAIVEPVTIDGASQPGFAGVPVIELNGVGAGSGTDGLRIFTSNCIIRSLVINRFTGDGIEIATNGNNKVEGCYVGLNTNGLIDLGNTLNGILITNSANNVIGGFDPTNRNYISGNNGSGINLGGATATNNSILGNFIGLNVTNGAVANSVDGIRLNAPFNTIGGGAGGSRNVISGNTSDGIEITTLGVNSVVKGNYIGTDSGGTIDRGNAADGILVSARNVTIGGTGTGEGNLISGNNSEGIQIDGTNVVVLGNLIGTDYTGANGLANTSHGVLINTTSRSNVIGGIVAGEANVIAFNTQDGISVAASVTSTNHAFRGNSIYSNGDLGIDLGTTGITANDAGDADTGANNQQNFPVLTTVTNTPVGTLISGSLNSRASTTYAVDFFANTLPDPSGAGEGQSYLGSTNLNTDGGGNVAFAISLPVITLPGRYISATATDPAGNTSEFATNVLAVSTVTGITFTVVNTNDSGAGSLRQAIIDANAAINFGDTIVFAITNLTTTITPASALPTIIDPVTIDGYTQSGAAANTSPATFNGTLPVRLSGTSAGAGANGLTLIAGNSTVRGLIITGFGSDGIELSGFGGNVIEGCIIGLDAAGTDQGNGANGVFISGSSNNLVGGSSPAARNVISGNNSDGVEINGATAVGNLVRGNLIGPGFNGTSDLGNSGDGVLVTLAGGNSVGGAASDAGNLISGNQGSGVELSGVSATNNLVLGNLIGTATGGVVALANSTHGVLITTSSHGNLIGGVNAGEANIIAFNTQDGINVAAATANTNNTFRGNSIFSNGSTTTHLGIDLGTDGINANDPGDPDVGANQLQNFPVLVTVTNTPAQVLISGSLNSRPSITYTLDFYASAAFDPSGAGEGQTWIGATNLATAADSNLTFAISLPVVNLAGRYVTATATDDAGNTSEFSTNVAAVSTVTGITFTVVNTNNSGAGSLRQAILDANAAITAGDTIAFAITNLSTIIRPSSALPIIIDPVVIDGTTQAGSATNTSPTAFNATLPVKLDGISAGAGVDGLAFTIGNNTVRGLDIINFTQDGIELSSGSNNVIEGCVIGLDMNNTDAGNAADGIHIVNSGGNMIGGTGLASRNVISGNNSRGIEISGAGSTGNQILGNLIGLGLNGTLDLGNSSDGILITASSGNTIGGASVSARNVISGNNGLGIQLASSASSTSIENNYVGTDVSGTLDLGNGGDGILLASSTNVAILSNLISGNGGDGLEINGANATNNIVRFNRIGTDVGGTNALANAINGINLAAGSRGNVIGGEGAGNIIAFNADDGVLVASGTNNSIRANSIFSNGAALDDLGIDLGTTGITPNDPGDADTGANRLQNFPVLTGVTNTPTEVLIAGSLNSAASTTFTLDLYSSVLSDTAGAGEGQTWLGSTNLSTDVGGNVSFLISFPITNLQGRYVSATATDPFGNTSEFSTNATAFSTVPGLTFTVVNTNSYGAGSLRQAIIDANAAITAGDTIAFAITNAGSPKTIRNTGLGVLPTIIDPVTIDGYTQPGSVTNSSLTAFNGTLMVRIDGTSVGVGLDALTFAVGNNTVRGLVLINYVGSTAEGLQFDGGGNNVVQGNLIGIDVDGTIHGNGGDGVRLNSSANNLIGGTSPAHRNVISGNGSDAVEINGVAATNNVVVGNLLGTDLTGTSDRGNSFEGVQINAAPFNTIGGTAPGSRNVISGNNDCGILLQNAGATNNLILGNYIGTDSTGTFDLGNANDGVFISGAAGNTVGGATLAARNVISGNNSDGITCSGTGANNNVIKGNIIGTDVNGLVNVGNTANGVFLTSAPANTIGGATAAEGNLISGNGSDGIEISGSTAATNVVRNNLIGTAADGTSAIPNGSHGIFITSSAHHNVIGGSGNTIGFNGLDGIYVASGGSNALRHNLIFSNGGLGIDLGTDGVTANDVNDVDTGANLLQNFPVLSAATNSPSGVIIAGSLDSAAGTSYDLDFFASSAGDPSGFGEGQVYLGSTNVTTDGSGHVAFLAAYPVVLTGRYLTATATDPNGNTSEFSPWASAASTIAPTNFTVITTNDTGPGSLRETILLANSFISGGNDTISFAIPGAGPHTIAPVNPLPVIADPVTIDGYTQPGASANTSCISNNAVLKIRLSGASAATGMNGLLLDGIGGTVIRGLCIVGFPGDGVHVSGGVDNAVEGCIIGLDTDGLSPLPNGSYGVNVLGPATSRNRIGGAVPAAGNIISANPYGILLSLSASNVVSGNLIGTDRSGTIDRGNDNEGVTVFGPNAFGNQIGGTSACERNVISGNGTYIFADHHGVDLISSRGTRVQGNIIGLDATGSQLLGNAASGVHLNGSSLNLIGGATAGGRNLISGNQNDGVELEFTSPSNTISGNFIGTDAAGTADRGNNIYGVLLAGAAYNVVEDNVISGNDNDALYVAGSASPGNRLVGNFIGVSASGSSPLGNFGTGIRIEQSDTQVGGTNGGDGNIIAFNSSLGVSVSSFAVRCPILGNSIYSNDNLGIDLNVNGVTANDSGDTDAGANNLQNFPVLSQALQFPAQTTISGSLNSRPNSPYRIEFFSSASRDPSDFGEGQTYLGCTNVTTDGSGNAGFLFGHPASIAFGNFITATATDATNNTSEFSGGRRVVPFDSIDLITSIADSADPASHATNLFYTITITNAGPTNATSVVATNILPVGTTFVNATSSQGSCTYAAGVVSCNLGTITNGGWATVTIEIATSITGFATDTVTVAAAQTDNDPSNNSDLEETLLGVANIGLTLTDLPDPVVAGQVLTNLVTVTNLGPDAATLVTVSFYLDGTVAPISSSVSQGSVTPFGNSFTFNAGTIPPGGSATMTVRGIPTLSGVVDHSANGSGAESDPTFANNSAFQSTTVVDGAGVLQFLGPSFSVTEAGPQALITVYRTGGTIGTVGASFLTSDGTALAGLDYSNTVGTVTFNNGESFRTILVPIIEDSAFECNEFFNMSLHSPTGGAVLIVATQAVVNIIENDLNPGGNVSAVSGSTNFLPAVPGNSSSFKSSVSADGRYVAFTSYAFNLVDNDLNSTTDVYVRDLLSQTTTLVSLSQSGLSSADNNSRSPIISGNGRYVVFDSYAGDLVANDHNGNLDVFLRDLLGGTTTLVSVNAAGTDSGNSGSFSSDPTRTLVSSNGQAVVFASYASNLTVTPDTNGLDDVFVFDLAGNSNRLVSVNLAGTGSGNSRSYDPVISADGQVAAFTSDADNLVASDANSAGDVFVRDLASGVTELISANLAATGSGNGLSWIPYISADGRYVAFQSIANDLATNDLTTRVDVYWRDRVAGVTRLVSADTSGAAAGNGSATVRGISADGRYVLFASDSDNLVPGDNNFADDVFLRDMQNETTELVSVNLAGTAPGNSSSIDPVLSGDGRHVAFESYATDLTGASKLSFYTDIFVRDLIGGVTRLVSFEPGTTNGGTSSSFDAAISFGGNVTSFTSNAETGGGGEGAVLMGGGGGMTDIWAHTFASNITELVSVSAPSHSANGSSSDPVISRDGLCAAFSSSANNLATNDANNMDDIFVKNLTTQAIELISVRLGGGSANGFSSNPSISSNGNFVAFQSYANNLVTGDGNLSPDVFVRDRVASSNILASVNLAGSASASGSSGNPAISPDGRYVVFESTANDLAANDNNSDTDVFLRDLLNGTTTLVSRNAAGTASANGASFGAVIEMNPVSGNVFVAYTSYADDLVNNDTNSNQDVFLYDVTAGSNRLASVNLTGSGSANHFSTNPRLAVDSASGNVLVSYSSLASNLVNNDANGSEDVFVFDRLSGTNRLVSVNLAGSGSGNDSSTDSSISADGRYVAFQSYATDLAAGDTNGQTDIFLRDLVAGTTRLVTVNCEGTASANGFSESPVISADGRYVTYISSAPDLVPGDFNGNGNIFRYDRSLDATLLISQNRFLTGGGNSYSSGARISGNGAAIVFTSYASDLVPADGNNSSDVFVWQAGAVVTAVDLSLDKRASTLSVVESFNFNYTLAVTNFGTLAATGVAVTDPLPAGVSFVSASTTQGTVTNSGNTVTANIGSLGNGNGARVTITVTALTPGLVNNTATATSIESDATPGNNSDSAAVTVTLVQPPMLTTTATNMTQFFITWPAATPDVFAMETTTRLNPVATWTPVTNSIFNNGSVRYVLITIATNDPVRFFRLKH